VNGRLGASAMAEKSSKIPNWGEISRVPNKPAESPFRASEATPLGPIQEG